MPPLTENPADCEIRSVIRYLKAKGVKAVEIHRNICEVYGQTIMSDGMVRKWVRVFKDGRKNVHDEERSGRPSVIINDLLQKFNEKVKMSRRFTISSFQKSYLKFHIVSCMKLFPNVLQWLSHQAANFYDEGIKKPCCSI